MHVTMLADHDASLNEGATSQRFEAGKTYEVPRDVGLAWIAAGAATAADEPPAPDEEEG